MVNGIVYGSLVHNITGVEVNSAGLGMDERMDEKPRANLQGLYKESIKLQRKVIHVLKQFSTSRHRSIGPSDCPCDNCVDTLGEDYKVVVSQNEILWTYTDHLI